MGHRALWLPALCTALCGAAVQAETTTRAVQVVRNSVQVAGHLIQPAVSGSLPAILFLPGDDGPRILSAAQRIAEAGFIVLALDYDPEHVARSSALVQQIAGETLTRRAIEAIGWLAEQPGVDAVRIGAIGSGAGGSLVLQLARLGKIRAGVVAGAAACSVPDDLLKIRSVPLLVVAGEQSGCKRANMAALQQRAASLNLPHTFRFVEGPEASLPAGAGLDDFLRRHVADAPRPAPESALPSDQRIARIADIMRSVNSADGTRGRLARSLATASAGAVPWDRIRSDAAILAESGNLLLALPPPKGSVSGWRERALEFRGATLVLLRAIDSRNLAAAQDALNRLSPACASCHADYR